MRIGNPRIILSITLLCSGVATCSISATPAPSSSTAIDEKACQEQVTTFCTASSQDNFDHGRRVQDLHTAVYYLLQYHVPEQAPEWQSFAIEQTPDQAARFLARYRKYIIPSGETKLAKKSGLSCIIRETMLWQILHHLLFDEDTSMFQYYNTRGWNALVTDARELAKGTQLEHVAHQLPRLEEFGDTLALSRLIEVGDTLSQHVAIFPKTLQNDLNDGAKQSIAQDRLMQLLSA